MRRGQLTLTVLGSGTSTGVPTIGCKCAVCMSSDEHDKRLRPSVLLRYNGRSVLIDVSPDFRQQALRVGLERLDAILLTHSHADHIMGLDDVRPFNFFQGSTIPVYGTEETLRNLKLSFHYIFETTFTESTIPKITLHSLDGQPFRLFGLTIEPITVFHGRHPIFGFRFGPMAYLTDHSDIPEPSLERLDDLDVLFLDALRERPHPTHSHIAKSLEYVERLRPKQAWFTHVGHDVMHAEIDAKLPAPAKLAYDGLELSVEVELDAEES